MTSKMVKVSCYDLVGLPASCKEELIRKRGAIPDDWILVRQVIDPGRDYITFVFVPPEEESNET